MSEMRGIIVVGTFLGIALTLILMMPPELLGATQTTIPNNQGLTNLLSINDTISYNFAGIWYRSPNIDVGGWHTCMTEAYPIISGITYSDNASRVFQFEITDSWYTYFYNREDFRWKDTNTETYIDFQTPILLPPSYAVETHYVITMNTLNRYVDNTAFTIQSSRCKMNIMFTYDKTIYTNPLNAYEHMGLSVQIGIDYNERNTQISAWSFVYNLFFFQDIEGLEPTVANLIRIPFVLALGYILFICVLRVIGAVFGGGGA